MSKPTRYTTKLLQSDKTGRLEICPCYEGEWVAYSDYAALAAELERMRSEHEVGFSSVVLKKWAAEHAALAAENERLRKACELVFGEAAKRKFLMCYPGNDFYVSLEAMQEMKNALGWNAPKEGGAK